MSRFNDPKAIREQYRDSSNLNALQQLHIRFSTNPTSWYRWVFDHFLPMPNSAVLELGCGPGDIWRENLDRMPEGIKIYLSDFSAGMVAKAKERLDEIPYFSYASIDAQNLPFADQTFHTVIANHMLYHVPERSRALHEIQRILKPGGMVYATTVGENHMKKLIELIRRFDPALAVKYVNVTPSFTLENGSDHLSAYFTKVERFRIEDSLIVTEVLPMVDYMLSTIRFAVPPEKISALRQHVKKEMDVGGGQIFITKDSGLFVASQR